MHYTTYYQVVRARPLDERELARVAALVREVNVAPWEVGRFELAIPRAPRPSAVIAAGSIRTTLTATSRDGDRICAALTRLQALLPDACVNADDDCAMIAWSREDDGFAFGRGRRRRLVDDEFAADAISVLALASPPKPVDDRRIAVALRALAAPNLTDGDAGALRAELAAHDPALVARVGLAAYAELHHAYPARAAVFQALDHVDELAGLEDALIAVWTHPRGTYYHGDLAFPESVALALGALPHLRDELIASVEIVLDDPDTASELDRRAASRAIDLLARGGDRYALALVRTWRERARPFAIEYDLYGPALVALGDAATAGAAPTLLLALDGCALRRQWDVRALIGAARAAPELAAPVVVELVEQGLGLEHALEAALAIGARAFAEEHVAPAARAHLEARLAAALAPLHAYPNAQVRTLAREVAALLRDDVVELADPGDPPPETLVAHPDLTVRHRALRTLSARRDLGLVHALALACTLDDALRVTTGAVGSPFSWWDWRPLLPDDALRLRPEALAAWAAGPGARVLGPQRALPALAPLAAHAPAALARSYRLRFDLSPATRDRLRAVEATARSL